MKKINGIVEVKSSNTSYTFLLLKYFPWVSIHKNFIFKNFAKRNKTKGKFFRQWYITLSMVVLNSRDLKEKVWLPKNTCLQNQPCSNHHLKN